MKRMRLIAALVLVLSCACGGKEPVEPPEPKGPPSAEVVGLAEANNALAIDLYGRLAGEEGNLFFSPTSVSSAMAMVYGGARGDTGRQIAAAMHFPEGEGFHAGFKAMTDRVFDTEAAKLTMANRLWLAEQFDVRPDYLTLTKQYYEAAPERMDFRGSPDKARQRINGWVEDQTNDRIKDLLPQGSVTPMTRVVVTNAIYFLGKWQHAFEKDDTRPMPFWVRPEKEVEVKMMFQNERFGYRRTERLQVLELPYKDGELSMLVLLPAEKDGLAELERSLTRESLKKWTANMPRMKLDVYLPKWRVTAQFTLNDALGRMGIEEAFSADNADFSGISEKQLFISTVVHKAFVEVDEEGTEAAAATGIVMETTAVRPRPEVFKADHPFVFLIRENSTKAILFMGRVVDPS